uniref:Uncharacterized protein n=1 Tax=candidate division WWE3 bacterium TaxID=2053526 RepID=A0A7C4XN25_UNCKA
MSVFAWEGIIREEIAAQKRRDLYLDMRNASRIAAKKSNNNKEYQGFYREAFEQLVGDFEERLCGDLRKRSENVWKSKRAV